MSGREPYARLASGGRLETRGERPVVSRLPFIFLAVPPPGPGRREGVRGSGEGEAEEITGQAKGGAREKR